MFLPLIPPWWPLSDAFPFLVLTWALTGLLVHHFLPWSRLRLLRMVEQEGAPGGAGASPAHRCGLVQGRCCATGGCRAVEAGEDVSTAVAF